MGQLALLVGGVALAMFATWVVERPHHEPAALIPAVVVASAVLARLAQEQPFIGPLVVGVGAASAGVLADRVHRRHRAQPWRVISATSIVSLLTAGTVVAALLFLSVPDTEGPITFVGSLGTLAVVWGRKGYTCTAPSAIASAVAIVLALAIVGADATWPDSPTGWWLPKVALLGAVMVTSGSLLFARHRRVPRNSARESRSRTDALLDRRGDPRRRRR